MKFTGKLSLYASTGAWKGQAKLCLHRNFIRVLWRNCSWLVMRPWRLGSFTGGCGGMGGPWGNVCGRDGLSKSSYSKEGLRMRLPELLCWSIPPPDSPTIELEGGDSKRMGGRKQYRVFRRSITSISHVQMFQRGRTGI